VKIRGQDAWLNPEGASESKLKKRTLTALYNQRPQWLDDAHQALDSAVLAAYNWPADLSGDEMLRRLLELNRQRASAGCAATQGSTPPKRETECRCPNGS
jgi:hypothetical protein